jgi:hypothetical protein
MGIDRTFADWPGDGDGDPIRGAALPLIEAIFAATHDGSAERAAALSELMASIDRIRLALRPKPTMQ